MANKRSQPKNMDQIVVGGHKKFVRYEEGAALFSLGLHSFEKLAKEARAVYHIKRIALVNTEIVEEYLESFRDE